MNGYLPERECSAALGLFPWSPGHRGAVTGPWV